jgi:hypothetical protein
MLGSVCGVPLRRVFRYVGTDVIYVLRGCVRTMIQIGELTRETHLVRYGIPRYDACMLDLNTRFACGPYVSCCSYALTAPMVQMTLHVGVGRFVTVWVRSRAVAKYVRLGYRKSKTHICSERKRITHDDHTTDNR